MIPGPGGAKNVILNKQPAMNNNMIMGKMVPNGPLMQRGIRAQTNNLSPNMGQRHQVSFSCFFYEFLSCTNYCSCHENKNDPLF